MTVRKVMKQEVISATMHAEHLDAQVNYEKVNGVSANVLQHERYQQKQFMRVEKIKGRAARLMSKSSQRKARKVSNVCIID